MYGTDGGGLPPRLLLFARRIQSSRRVCVSSCLFVYCCVEFNFIGKRCSVGPMGTNTIIYGHHMKNGTMFAWLEEYENEDYYKEYPVIHFDTLYEQQAYGGKKG